VPDILLTNHYGLIKDIKFDRKIPTYSFGLSLSEHLQAQLLFQHALKCGKEHVRRKQWSHITCFSCCK